MLLTYLVSRLPLLYLGHTDKKPLASNDAPVNRTGQKPGFVVSSRRENNSRRDNSRAASERADHGPRQSAEKVVCAIICAAKKNEYRMKRSIELRRAAGCQTRIFARIKPDRFFKKK